jgi:hypothetical protein
VLWGLAAYRFNAGPEARASPVARGHGRSDGSGAGSSLASRRPDQGRRRLHVRGVPRHRAAVRQARPGPAAGAIGYGLAAALFTGTTWVPAAHLGAFAWGASGTLFYTVAATTLQRLAPPGTLGRVMGVISTAESATETASMPLAGALVAVAGIRPGALAIAAVAAAAGVAALTA